MGFLGLCHRVVDRIFQSSERWVLEALERCKQHFKGSPRGFSEDKNASGNSDRKPEPMRLQTRTRARLQVICLYSGRE